MRQFPINSFRFMLSMSFPEVDEQQDDERDPLVLEPLTRGNELFICLDCGVDTYKIREYFMVYDHIWDEHVPEYRGFLCVGCLENRMGRILDATDFPDHLPINHPDGLFFPHSERLRSRLNPDAAEDRVDLRQS